MSGREISFRDWMGDNYHNPSDDHAPTEHERAVPFDEGKCATCGDWIGAGLREDPNTGAERSDYRTMYLLDDGRYVCEDCADGARCITCDLPMIDWPHDQCGEPPVAGVDYDVASCPVCGSSESHDHAPREYANALGTFDDPSGYWEQRRDTDR